jgi:hypothetical protein
MGMPRAFIELVAALANLRPDDREHLVASLSSDDTLGRHEWSSATARR